MMRRLLAEPRVALARVTPVASFARFRAPMAMFSEERAPSRPFGSCGLVVMVGTQGGNVGAVGKNPDSNGGDYPSCRRAPCRRARLKKGDLTIPREGSCGLSSRLGKPYIRGHSKLFLPHMAKAKGGTGFLCARCRHNWFEYTSYNRIQVGGCKEMDMHRLVKETFTSSFHRPTFRDRLRQTALLFLSIPTCPSNSRELNCT